MLEQFDGPLELLLHLIEDERLDITTVSLGRVTEQFLAYLKEEKTVALPHLSAFLTIAAKLLLLKSRALLPILHFETDEDPVDDLEYRLRVYKIFRDAATRLGGIVGRKQPAFSREGFLGEAVVFYPPSSLSVHTLRDAYGSVLGTLPQQQVLEEEHLETIVTLEERIFHLESVLSEQHELSFGEFSQSALGRTDIIVTFLALLELIKRQVVVAHQAHSSHDIVLRRHHL